MKFEGNDGPDYRNEQHVKLKGKDNEVPETDIERGGRLADRNEDSGGLETYFGELDDFPGNGVDYLWDYPSEVFESEGNLDDIPAQDGYERSKRPLFVEVYCGKGGLSQAMRERGFDVISVDRPEWDLNQLGQRKALLTLMDRLDPEVVWCAPPCPLWSSSRT